MERFINIYDNCTEFTLHGKSLKEQYAELGMEEKFAYTRHRIDYEIIRRVFDCLKYDKDDFWARVN